MLSELSTHQTTLSSRHYKQQPTTSVNPQEEDQLGIPTGGLSQTAGQLLALNDVLKRKWNAYVLDETPQPPALAPAALKPHPSLCALKRAMDVLLALFALLLSGPLLLLCTIITRCSSGSPILFKQQRIGRDGRYFTIYKFRTMVKNAEQVLDEHLARNCEARREWEQTRKLRADPRITRIGKVMRRFSLDELPQLINVLRGDMSLVGPRPIVDSEKRHYQDAFDDYCRVRPGLTGLWQVSGRSDTSYEMRTALDRQYVQNWSVSRDLHILRRTVAVVLSASGAY